MHLLVLIGITFYFVTSSDSGSYVDDIISAQGPREPAVDSTRLLGRYGSCHRASVAFRFGPGLSTIQGVSIVAGLRTRIAICYCCTSLYRALKREMRDEDIMAQRHGFVVSSLDILELYSPEYACAIAIGGWIQLEHHRLVLPIQRSQDRRRRHTTTMLWVQSSTLLLLLTWFT